MLKIWTIALSALFAGTVHSGIIDFEGYDAGTIIDNEYVDSHGVTIRGVNIDRINNSSKTSIIERAKNIGVVFDSENYTGRDRDLSSPFTNAAGEKFNPGNILIIHEHPNECNLVSCGNDPDDEGSRPAGFFEVVFAQAVTLNSIDFFDIEYGEASQPKFEIELFSDRQFNTAIQDDSFFVPDTGGDNTWDRALFDVDNIMSIRINLGGSGAIDNINFSVKVPEPAAWALLSVCLLGLLRRRKLL